MNQIIDRDGHATVASAEGESALNAGDTERARDRFAEAGVILEGEMRKMGDKETENLLRFLAATQFYKGGHYRKALELAGRIIPAKLPVSTRHLIPGFVKDVKVRASSNYEARIRDQMQSLWTAKDFSGIIELLQEHPYIVPAATLAYLRAICCETLGKYHPATLFFADAARRSQDPQVMAALAPLPLNLAAHGRLEEAWEYVQAQVEHFPNAVSYAIASFLRYEQARRSEGDAKTARFKEQMDYFERAREEYARLSTAHQDSPKVKLAIGLGYEAAAHTLYLSGDMQAARETCDAAINLDPTSPNAWTLRGVLMSGAQGVVQPNDEATDAFKKAVELGDRTAAPFCYLAYDALMKGEYREALDWSRKALDRLGEKQAPDVKSALYQYVAISLADLGAPREEIEEFFIKAVEIAPHSEFATKNYRHFQASEPPERPPLPTNGSQQAGLGVNLVGIVADHESKELTAHWWRNAGLRALRFVADHESKELTALLST